MKFTNITLVSPNLASVLASNSYNYSNNSNFSKIIIITKINMKKLKNMRKIGWPMAILLQTSAKGLEAL